jgi:hypothetical protein
VVLHIEPKPTVAWDAFGNTLVSDQVVDRNL